MKGKEVIVAGIAGTTAFTVFSYLASAIFKENFKEPELLGDMVDTVTPQLHETQSQFTGWLMHYATGIGFAAAYKQLLKLTGAKPTVVNGIITGAITGYPASFVWDTTLKKHPLPPRRRSLSFYLQLTAGHAIFGAVIFSLYKYFDARKPL